MTPPRLEPVGGQTPNIVRKGNIRSIFAEAQLQASYGANLPAPLLSLISQTIPVSDEADFKEILSAILADKIKIDLRTGDFSPLVKVGENFAYFDTDKPEYKAIKFFWEYTNNGIAAGPFLRKDSLNGLFKIFVEKYAKLLSSLKADKLSLSQKDKLIKMAKLFSLEEATVAGLGDAEFAKKLIKALSEALKKGDNAESSIKILALETDEKALGKIKAFFDLVNEGIAKFGFDKVEAPRIFINLPYETAYSKGKYIVDSGVLVEASEYSDILPKVRSQKEIIIGQFVENMGRLFTAKNLAKSREFDSVRQVFTSQGSSLVNAEILRKLFLAEITAEAPIEKSRPPIVDVKPTTEDPSVRIFIFNRGESYDKASFVIKLGEKTVVSCAKGELIYRDKDASKLLELERRLDSAGFSHLPNLFEKVLAFWNSHNFEITGVEKKALDEEQARAGIKDLNASEAEQFNAYLSDSLKSGREESILKLVGNIEKIISGKMIYSNNRSEILKSAYVILRLCKKNMLDVENALPAIIDLAARAAMNFDQSGLEGLSSLFAVFDKQQKGALTLEAQVIANIIGDKSEKFLSGTTDIEDILNAFGLCLYGTTGKKNFQSAEIVAKENGGMLRRFEEKGSVIKEFQKMFANEPNSDFAKIAAGLKPEEVSAIIIDAKFADALNAAIINNKQTLRSGIPLYLAVKYSPIVSPRLLALCEGSEQIKDPFRILLSYLKIQASTEKGSKVNPQFISKLEKIAIGEALFDKTDVQLLIDAVSNISEEEVNISILKEAVAQVLKSGKYGTRLPIWERLLAADPKALKHFILSVSIDIEGRFVAVDAPKAWPKDAVAISASDRGTLEAAGVEPEKMGKAAPIAAFNLLIARMSPLSLTAEQYVSFVKFGLLDNHLYAENIEGMIKIFQEKYIIDLVVDKEFYRTLKPIKEFIENKTAITELGLTEKHVAVLKKLLNFMQKISKRLPTKPEEGILLGSEQKKLMEIAGILQNSGKKDANSRTIADYLSKMPLALCADALNEGDIELLRKLAAHLQAGKTVLSDLDESKADPEINKAVGLVKRLIYSISASAYTEEDKPTGFINRLWAGVKEGVKQTQVAQDLTMFAAPAGGMLPFFKFAFFAGAPDHIKSLNVFQAKADSLLGPRAPYSVDNFRQPESMKSAEGYEKAKAGKPNIDKLESELTAYLGSDELKRDENLGVRAGVLKILNDIKTFQANLRVRAHKDELESLAFELATQELYEEETVEKGKKEKKYDGIEISKLSVFEKYLLTKNIVVHNVSFAKLEALLKYAWDGSDVELEGVIEETSGKGDLKKTEQLAKLVSAYEERGLAFEKKLNDYKRLYFFDQNLKFEKYLKGKLGGKLTNKDSRKELLGDTENSGKKAGEGILLYYKWDGSDKDLEALFMDLLGEKDYSDLKKRSDLLNALIAGSRENAKDKPNRILRVFEAKEKFEGFLTPINEQRNIYFSQYAKIMQYLSDNKLDLKLWDMLKTQLPGIFQANFDTLPEVSGQAFVIGGVIDGQRVHCENGEQLIRFIEDQLNASAGQWVDASVSPSDNLRVIFAKQAFNMVVSTIPMDEVKWNPAGLLFTVGASQLQHSGMFPAISKWINPLTMGAVRAVINSTCPDSTYSPKSWNEFVEFIDGHRTKYQTYQQLASLSKPRTATELNQSIAVASMSQADKLASLGEGFDAFSAQRSIGEKDVEGFLKLLRGQLAGIIGSPEKEEPLRKFIESGEVFLDVLDESQRNNIFVALEYLAKYLKDSNSRIPILDPMHAANLDIKDSKVRLAALYISLLSADLNVISGKVSTSKSVPTEDEPIYGFDPKKFLKVDGRTLEPRVVTSVEASGSLFAPYVVEGEHLSDPFLSDEAYERMKAGLKSALDNPRQTFFEAMKSGLADGVSFNVTMSFFIASSLSGFVEDLIELGYDKAKERFISSKTDLAVALRDAYNKDKGITESEDEREIAKIIIRLRNKNLAEELPREAGSFASWENWFAALVKAWEALKAGNIGYAMGFGAVAAPLTWHLIIRNARVLRIPIDFLRGKPIAHAKFMEYGMVSFPISVTQNTLAFLQDPRMGRRAERRSASTYSEYLLSLQQQMGLLQQAQALQQQGKTKKAHNSALKAQKAGAKAEKLRLKAEALKQTAAGRTQTSGLLKEGIGVVVRGATGPAKVALLPIEWAYGKLFDFGIRNTGNPSPQHPASAPKRDVANPPQKPGLPARVWAHPTWRAGVEAVLSPLRPGTIQRLIGIAKKLFGRAGTKEMLNRLRSMFETSLSTELGKRGITDPGHIKMILRAARKQYIYGFETYSDAKEFVKYLEKNMKYEVRKLITEMAEAKGIQFNHAGDGLIRISFLNAQHVAMVMQGKVPPKFLLGMSNGEFESIVHDHEFLQKASQIGESVRAEAMKQMQTYLSERAAQYAAAQYGELPPTPDSTPGSISEEPTNLVELSEARARRAAADAARGTAPAPTPTGPLPITDPSKAPDHSTPRVPEPPKPPRGPQGPQSRATVTDIASRRGAEPEVIHEQIIIHEGATLRIVHLEVEDKTTKEIKAKREKSVRRAFGHEVLEVIKENIDLSKLSKIEFKQLMKELSQIDISAVFQKKFEMIRNFGKEKIAVLVDEIAGVRSNERAKKEAKRQEAANKAMAVKSAAASDTSKPAAQPIVIKPVAVQNPVGNISENMEMGRAWMQLKEALKAPSAKQAAMALLEKDPRVGEYFKNPANKENFAKLLDGITRPASWKEAAKVEGAGLLVGVLVLLGTDQIAKTFGLDRNKQAHFIVTLGVAHLTTLKIQYLITRIVEGKEKANASKLLELLKNPSRLSRAMTQFKTLFSGLAQMGFASLVVDGAMDLMNIENKKVRAAVNLGGSFMGPALVNFLKGRIVAKLGEKVLNGFAVGILGRFAAGVGFTRLVTDTPAGILLENYELSVNARAFDEAQRLRASGKWDKNMGATLEFVHVLSGAGLEYVESKTYPEFTAQVVEEDIQFSKRERAQLADDLRGFLDNGGDISFLTKKVEFGKERTSFATGTVSCTTGKAETASFSEEDVFRYFFESAKQLKLQLGGAEHIAAVIKRFGGKITEKTVADIFEKSMIMSMQARFAALYQISPVSYGKADFNGDIRRYFNDEGILIAGKKADFIRSFLGWKSDADKKAEYKITDLREFVYLGRDFNPYQLVLNSELFASTAAALEKLGFKVRSSQPDLSGGSLLVTAADTVSYDQEFVLKALIEFLVSINVIDADKAAKAKATVLDTKKVNLGGLNPLENLQSAQVLSERLLLELTGRMSKTTAEDLQKAMDVINSSSTFEVLPIGNYGKTIIKDGQLVLVKWQWLAALLILAYGKNYVPKFDMTFKEFDVFRKDPKAYIGLEKLIEKLGKKGLEIK